MICRSILALLSILALYSLPLQTAQVSNDWRNRYGPPQAERYVLRGRTTMNVIYSENGQTCKAIIESAGLDSKGLPNLQSKNKMEAILNEVIPIPERGPQIRSIGLSSNVGGIASVQYERITISFAVRDQTAAENVASTTIRWNGVKCRPPDEEGHATRP
jgi:hypothetical protein